MKSGIYRIRCIHNNKVYIGCSIDVDSRLPRRELAKIYNVSLSTIDRIINGKTYKE